MVLFRYKDGLSMYIVILNSKDKTATNPSYINSWNAYTGKTATGKHDISCESIVIKSRDARHLCQIEEQRIWRLPLVTLHLTHWGAVTHICVSKLNIVGSDNGLSPGRRQAIIWTNTGILLIWPLGTNFIEMFIFFHSRKCTWKCRLRKGGHFASA